MSEEIYLYPEELSTDPAYNTRLWPLDVAAQKVESDAIRAMADSIGSQGQLDAAVAVVDPLRPLPHVLVIGHRRRRAIAELNAAAPEASWRKLRVRVDRTGADMFQRAAHSNILVKSLSPIELACLIHYVRRKQQAMGQAAGLAATHAIAQYLGLQYATTLQYEKLLTQSDPATQSALHSGLIRPDSAFDLLDALESKRAAIIDLAKKIESEALVSKPSAYHQKELMRENRRTMIRITRPSVLKAIKQLDGQIRPIARSRTDIGKLILELDTPQYGFVNGDIRQWAKAFFEFIQGVVPQEEVDQKFAKLTQKSYRGTETDLDHRKKLGPKLMKNKDRLPRIDKGYFRPPEPLKRRSKIEEGIEL